MISGIPWAFEAKPRNVGMKIDNFFAELQRRYLASAKLIPGLEKCVERLLD